jgi:hypothetical protein
VVHMISFPDDLCKDCCGWAQGHQNLQHDNASRDLCKDCCDQV